MCIAVVCAQRALVDGAANDTGPRPARIARAHKRAHRVRASRLPDRTVVCMQCALVNVAARDAGTRPARIACTRE